MCLHICTCSCAHVVLLLVFPSVRSHVCVKARIYLRFTCGLGSRQPMAVKARPETKCPASFSLSRMTLLTDMTVSASLSPGGRPTPPPNITTAHFSLSHDSLGLVTQQPPSHRIYVYVYVVNLSHRIQTLIFQLFFSCSSEKIMDSNVHKQTYWTIPPQSSFCYHRISYLIL